MYGNKPFGIAPRYFLSVTLIVVCLTGVLLAQTFHYSVGWTNGRKRSSLLSLDNRKQEPEILGICQMLKLKYIVERRQHSEANLSHEELDRGEDDVTRQRRKGSIETTPIFDSLPIMDT